MDRLMIFGVPTFNVSSRHETNPSVVALKFSIEMEFLYVINGFYYCK